MRPHTQQGSWTGAAREADANRKDQEEKNGYVVWAHNEYGHQETTNQDISLSHRRKARMQKTTRPRWKTRKRTYKYGTSTGERLSSRPKTEPIGDILFEPHRQQTEGREERREEDADAED